MKEDAPFEVTKKKRTAAWVRFAPIVDHQRLPEYDHQLNSLVDQFKTVVCDLGGSEEIVSTWLRKLCELTKRAEAAGKTVVVVGMQPAVGRTADGIKAKKCLRLAANADKVWPK
jgi:anti-anti-sigma regulatory factor